MTALPAELRLIGGKGNGKTTACLMSARALLDGRPFSDEHPSRVLRNVGIRINDAEWWPGGVDERTRTLLPLAMDERLCASKCDASREAELLRARMAADWSLSWVAPHALDSAAIALDKAGRTEDAKALRDEATALRATPTAAQANKARARARSAYAYAAADAAADAADAAAYAADIAYAAYAAYAAYYAADAAADAADAAADAAYAADAPRRIEVRDALIALFGRLLDVRATPQV